MLAVGPNTHGCSRRALLRGNFCHGMALWSLCVSQILHVSLESIMPDLSSLLVTIRALQQDPDGICPWGWFHLGLPVNAPLQKCS